MRKVVVSLLCFLLCVSLVFADDRDTVINDAEQVYNAARTLCSGISDEIAKVANISKANTVVTAVGTVAAGGALVAGIKKSREEEQIDSLIVEICNKGGCSADAVNSMNDSEFFENILQPMAQIVELQKKIDKSKKLGNWRTGLMGGTIGTNLASAIMSGLNVNQSDLIQHIHACKDIVKMVSNTELNLKAAGVGPNDAPVVKELSDVKTWCDQIDVKDVEKIENHMKAVMGTSVAGTAVGIAGVGTSAAANSNKYMTKENKLILSDTDKQKEKTLNTVANVMAGANVATGVAETGLNISLISLTKKLIKQAGRCEEVLK